MVCVQFQIDLRCQSFVSSRAGNNLKLGLQSNVRESWVGSLDSGHKVDSVGHLELALNFGLLAGPQNDSVD